MDLFAKFFFRQHSKVIWFWHGNTHPIPFEFQQNKRTCLLSRPVFPLLCTLVQSLIIVRKDSSTYLALWSHSTALLFEKSLADSLVFSCCLFVNNSQHLKVISALWSALRFWFPTTYKWCEITECTQINVWLLEVPTHCEHPHWISWNLTCLWLPTGSGIWPWREGGCHSCSLSTFGSFCNKHQGDWCLLWHVSSVESDYNFLVGPACPAWGWSPEGPDIGRPE